MCEPVGNSRKQFRPSGICRMNDVFFFHSKATFILINSGGKGMAAFFEELFEAILADLNNCIFPDEFLNSPFLGLGVCFYSGATGGHLPVVFSNFCFLFLIIPSFSQKNRQLRKIQNVNKSSFSVFFQEVCCHPPPSHPNVHPNSPHFALARSE